MLPFYDVIMTNLGKHRIHIVTFHATQSLKFETGKVSYLPIDKHNIERWTLYDVSSHWTLYYLFNSSVRLITRIYQSSLSLVHCGVNSPVISGFT